MANSYNPQPRFMTMSSTSSENDIEEVRIGKSRFGIPPANPKLNRTISDPVGVIYSKGKEDIKSTGKTSALSDSSNFAKRMDSSSFMSAKSINDTFKTSISDVSQQQKDRPISPDGVFPEPESIRRERTKDTNVYSILYEEDDNVEDISEGDPFRFHGGAGQDIPDTINDETGFLGDIAFQTSRIVQELESVTSPAAAIDTYSESVNLNYPAMVDGDDDDDTLPEIEHFPKGYSYGPFDDMQNFSSFATEATISIRSYDDGSDAFPEPPSPSELFVDNWPGADMKYSELEKVDSPPAIPSSPFRFM